MARRVIRPARGPKRLTSWFQFVHVENTITAAGGTIYYTLNSAALALRPFTVVRPHFELHLRSDQASAIEHQAAAFGIAIVSDQATAIGVTAVPTPATDMGSDLWFLQQNLFADESALTDRTRSSSKVSVDSKAMRKVDIGQDMVVVAELASPSSGFILGVAGRMPAKVN